MKPRKANIKRLTDETRIHLKLVIDGKGNYSIETGIPFFDHMLCLFAKHAVIDLDLKCVGDLEVDAHHTVEDIGITLGQAVAKAIGDKKGVRRYGHAYVPLDEALSRVVIDYSGRPSLDYHVTYPRSHVGEFDVDFSLIEDATDATISGDENILGTPPLLLTLADNGGPTPTNALLPGSPAIQDQLKAQRKSSNCLFQDH